MDIQHAAIGASTILTQLLIALQREGVLSEQAIDAILRESVSLNGQKADHPANLVATRFVQEVWSTVRDERKG